MLLGISEFLANCWDFIAAHCAEVGITLSIPFVVCLICKIIYKLVKDKAVLKKFVSESLSEIKKDIADLKDYTKDQICQIETKFGERLDTKFIELKEKRKELYNDIYSGIDCIEEKTQKAIEEIEQEVTNVSDEIIEEIQEKETAIEKSEDDSINPEDILR